MLLPVYFTHLCFWPLDSFFQISTVKEQHYQVHVNFECYFDLAVLQTYQIQYKYRSQLTGWYGDLFHPMVWAIRLSSELNMIYNTCVSYTSFVSNRLVSPDEKQTHTFLIQKHFFFEYHRSNFLQGFSKNLELLITEIVCSKSCQNSFDAI